MITCKKVVISIFCLVFITGCITSQKKVVTPSSSPVFSEEDLPLPSEGYEGSDPGSIPKEVVQPLDIEGFEIDEEETQPLGVAERSKVQSVLPSMDYVNDRIFEYGRKLNRWKEIDDQAGTLNLSQEDTVKMVSCFKDLKKVLDGYNRLRADMIQLEADPSALIIGTEEVMKLQKSDIHFLEGTCGPMLGAQEVTKIDWEQREEGADLPQIETLIERYTESKEYEDVVQAWSKINQNQIDRVHLRTKILYGNALMFLHQEDKAAEIYQQIVDEMSVSDKQRTDLLSLRKVLADLYTASGNYSSAQGQYVAISEDYTNLGQIEEWSQLQLDILERSDKGSPELVAYSKLLRNFLGFVPERDGYKLSWEADEFLLNYPYSAIASNVDIIKNNVQKRADKWFDGFMGKVDSLAKEKKYVDGIEMLEIVPDDIISSEQKEKIKAKNDELILAESVERETRKIERMQDLQHRWNKGMLLVDEGEYDKAIETFSSLLETEYYAKAEDKIKEVSLRAAKADRRKAADLFLRYTKTSDLESRKKLLIESRKLLSEILIKYPEVDIAEKVMGHIKRVEKEMNTIDPTLLQSMQNQSNSSVDEFGGTTSEPGFGERRQAIIDRDTAEGRVVQ